MFGFKMIFGFIIIVLQICICHNKQHLINDVLDVVTFTEGGEIVFVKASKVSYFKFSKDAFNSSTFINSNHELCDISLSIINDTNEMKALFKVNGTEYELDTDSLSIDLQSKTNFTIRISPKNTPTTFELIYLNNRSHIFNGDNNITALYSNSSNFTYKDGQNYIIQSFLFKYSSIFPIILIVMGITITFSGYIYNSISLCFICICCIASVIDEMILNHLGFLTYVIGGFLILFSVIFGVCLSLYIIYCNERITLGILLSSSLICLLKIVMSLTHTNIEHSLHIYNVVYFLSIVIGVVFCVCKGKNVQKKINTIDKGFPNEIVSLFVYPKIKFAKMLILFYIIPYSIIGAVMITSGINYTIGGNYYWKLYKYKGFKLNKGNERLFVIMSAWLFVVGVVFQFISFCFVMESKEIEYEVDIAESIFIQNDDDISKRIAVDDNQIMMRDSTINNCARGEERNSQLGDYDNDNNDDNESEIKDSFPLAEDEE